VTVRTPNGLVTALVVPQTTMSQSSPGSRDDLKVGAVVFVPARPDAAGKMTAARVDVGKDGVNPGQ
jgi:hypothetical protein